VKNKGLIYQDINVWNLVQAHALIHVDQVNVLEAVMVRVMMDVLIHVNTIVQEFVVAD